MRSAVMNSQSATAIVGMPAATSEPKAPAVPAWSLVASRDRLIASSATPTSAIAAHSRRPRRSFSVTWLSTRSTTIPDTKMGWTTEIGTSDSATTWSPRPSSIEQNPITQTGEESTEPSRWRSRRAWTDSISPNPCFSSTKPTL